MGTSDWGTGTSGLDAQKLLSRLEATNETALIRVYKFGDADRLEEFEAPLFARYGFRPIAHQDYSERRIGYLLFPFQVRAVCFAR